MSSEISESTGGEAALLSVLVTEHFVLQSVRSTTTSEATSRAALYLATLSSAMIALGFASTDPATLRTFLVAVLPVVLILGVVTFMRLVDLGIQDLRRLQDIERIKDYYRAMPAPAPDFFPPVPWSDARALLASQDMRPGPTQLLSTSAAMVGVITSFVFAVGCAVTLNEMLPRHLAVLVGAAAGMSAFALALRFQWHRNTDVFDKPSAAGIHLTEPDGG